MRITIAALGTRGDVQPMIALAKGLMAAGYDITFIAGSNFAEWIRGHGLHFLPSVDMEKLMNSDQGLAWSEGSSNPMRELRIMRDLMNAHGQAMYAPILESVTATDLFISGFVSEPLVQSISEKYAVPYINALLQPQQATRSGPASLNPIIPRGKSLLNLWMGQFSERLLWSIAAPTTNHLRSQQLGLPEHTASNYIRAKRLAPTLLGFSRHVVPPAPDWGSSTTTTGYWFLDEQSGWQPSAQLTTFLQSGAPPVYIGFGSMSNRDPQKTMDLMLKAVQQSRQRAVIAAGWGGIQVNNESDEVLVIDHAPHEWLFSRVSAVVHHGGAGTTGAGLRAGKPTMIIPHMSDQPFWGRRVHELGVGVKPVPRHRLTSDALAHSLEALVGSPIIQANASALGELIRAENGIDAAIKAIGIFSQNWKR